MAKYQMYFQGFPHGLVGEVRFSSYSTLNGKTYKYMTEEEKTRFRQIFLDGGASKAVPDDEGKYEYNIRV